MWHLPNDVFLINRLEVLYPAKNFEFYGFDVSDCDIQEDGFFESTIGFLNKTHPGVKWQERIKLITIGYGWPYPDEFFDITLSNQVFEHVQAHDFVFSELARVIKRGGVSINVFPLKSSIFECHVNVPFAHWISHQKLAHLNLMFWNLLGIGKYKKHKRNSNDLTLRSYAITTIAKLQSETNYKSAKGIEKFSENSGLLCDFRYTSALYFSWLRRIFKLRPICRYKFSWLNRYDYWLYSLAASVTMVLRKPKD